MTFTDLRIKLSKALKRRIYERIEAGETQAQVGARRAGSVRALRSAKIPGTCTSAWSASNII